MMTTGSNCFLVLRLHSAIALPGNREGWLDENSLARFVVEIMGQLDTSPIEPAILIMDYFVKSITYDQKNQNNSIVQ